MVIRPNKVAADNLYQKLSDALEAEVRTGVHVSDLLQPLKAYWSKVDPRPPSRDEVGYWLAGKAHHFFLVQALTGIDDSQEASLVDPVSGIHYSPDLVELKGEFKTTRWAIMPTTAKAVEKVVSSYVPQCRAYAALMHSLEWNLYMFYLTALDLKTKRKIPRLKVYTLVFTEGELEDERVELAGRAASLENAVLTANPESLPLCSPFICYRMKGNGRGHKKTIEGVCKWWDVCKPKGRYPDEN